MFFLVSFHMIFFLNGCIIESSHEVSNIIYIHNISCYLEST